MQLDEQSELWMSRNVDSTAERLRERSKFGFLFIEAASASESGNKDTTVSTFVLRPTYSVMKSPDFPDTCMLDGML